MGRAWLVLAASLTKIHPGAGRSPGTVDLPVVRDPLGVWYMPGSELKGAIKTLLARKKRCIQNGRISCNNKDCRALCCLLGGETAEPGASSLALLDLYPILVPLPSSREGIVYVTGRPLLARLRTAAEAAGNNNLGNTIETILAGLSSLGPAEAFLLVQKNQKDGYDFVAGRKISIKSKKVEAGALWNTLKKVSPLLEHVPPEDRVLIVGESLLTVLLDSALIRQTRVRISRTTKTVVEGGLWTEEYIPWGTVFSGLILDTGFRNKYCGNGQSDPIGEFMRELPSHGKGGRFVDLVVGGKETVGAGLLRLYFEAPEGG